MSQYSDIQGTENIQTFCTPKFLTKWQMKTADPDQTALKQQFDQDLSCFYSTKYLNPGPAEPRNACFCKEHRSRSVGF